MARRVNRKKPAEQAWERLAGRLGRRLGRKGAREAACRGLPSGDCASDAGRRAAMGKSDCILARSRQTSREKACRVRGIQAAG